MTGPFDDGVRMSPAPLPHACPPECAQNWQRASDPLKHVDHCPHARDEADCPPNGGYGVITSHDDQPDDPEAAADRSGNPEGATQFPGHRFECSLHAGWLTSGGEWIECSPEVCGDYIVARHGPV